MINYIDRENKKSELLNLLMENKITEEETSDYIMELNLSDNEIDQLDEALGAVAGAVGKGLATLGKGVLKGGKALAKGAVKGAGTLAKKAAVGGIKLGKKAVVGGAKLAGQAVGTGVKAYKQAAGTQQAQAQPQAQAQAQAQVAPQQQQNIMTSLNTLMTALQNNPQALQLLQQFIPQLKKTAGLA